MRSIPIRRRDGTTVNHALVDDEDYDELVLFTWTLHDHGYAQRSVGLRTVYMHREIFGLQPGDKREPDHIDGDRLNNTRTNMRLGTKAQNLQNRVKPNRNNSSGHRGVTWNRRRGKWQAKVMVARKTNHLGYFDDVDEAAAAAAAFRREHMPFARS